MAHFLIMYYPPRETFLEDITEREKSAVARHAEYLENLLKAKKVKMAGRCEDARFGIALLEVENKIEAADIMENDPAIVAKVFTGELISFSLAMFD